MTHPASAAFSISSRLFLISRSFLSRVYLTIRFLLRRLQPERWIHLEPLPPLAAANRC
jgi:hypothetical protein